MSASCWYQMVEYCPLKFNQAWFEILNVIIIAKISKGKLESRDSCYEANEMSKYFVTRIHVQAR